jgi:crossover junction endodeoxyribonuclease RusA
VKPIQDALVGVAYVDDRQVIDLVVSARSKTGNYQIRMTSTLASGFRGNSDFVYIVVEESTVPEVFA